MGKNERKFIGFVLENIQLYVIRYEMCLHNNTACT